MKIVQDGDPVLRQKATEIANDEFGTPAFQKLIDDMEKALDAEADGVALAAPQIGVGKRVFIVRYDRMMAPVAEGEPERPASVGVYVNPVFVKRSRKKEEMDEGCLSVRGTYGKTMRHERATVKAKDEHGKKFERGAGGILAQAFQHETDHLDGILFIDHATHTVEVEVEDRPKRPRRQSGWIPPEGDE